MSTVPAFDFYEMFRSVEIVWVLWVFGILLLPVIVYVAALRSGRFSVHPFRLSTFHADQHGASYSLSFVLTLPFIVALIVLILETSFLLVAKFGTMHAAFMAARAAIVWTTSDEKDVPVQDASTYFNNFPDVQKKAKTAAVRAMVPFSSGFFTRGGAKDAEMEEAIKFLAVYKNYVAGSKTEITSQRGGTMGMRDNYIRNKYVYAERFTTVKIVGKGDSGPKEPWALDVEAEVSYEYPVMIPKIPLLGNFYGRKASDGRHVFDLVSTAVFQNECPRNKDATLGIKSKSK